MSAPTLSLSIQFVDTIHKDILPRPLLRKWVMKTLFADGQLTLRFVDTEEGRSLNRTWRGKDYATNVLTFAYAESEDDPVSGDIIICCPVIAQEAKEQNKTLEEHYAHMIVHGILHAQGYDHEVEDEAEEMEALEIELLAELGFANPYAQ